MTKDQINEAFSYVIETLFKSAFKTSFHYLCVKNVTTW